MASLNQPLPPDPARRERRVSLTTATAADRQSSPIIAVAGLIGAILFGAAATLFDRFLVAGSAGRAESALLAIPAGDLAGFVAGLDALIVFSFAKFGAPLLILAGLVAIEAGAAGGRGRARWSDPAWPVQLVLMTITSAALLTINQLVPWPEPLIRIDAVQGSLERWAMVIPLLLLSVFAVDLLAYWVHRAQHRFAILWRFHAVHHSQRLDVLHNINHPLDLTVGFLLAVLPIALLIQVSAAELLLLAGFFVIQTSLNHMRAPINLGPLGAILSDNRFHFIHHSRDPADFNANFAARFPVIDMIFGTYRKPRAELPDTGLSDRPPPVGVGQHLLALWPKQQI